MTQSIRYNNAAISTSDSNRIGIKSGGATSWVLFAAGRIFIARLKAVMITPNGHCIQSSVQNWRRLQFGAKFKRADCVVNSVHCYCWMALGRLINLSPGPISPFVPIAHTLPLLFPFRYFPSKKKNIKPEFINIFLNGCCLPSLTGGAGWNDGRRCRWMFPFLFRFLFSLFLFSKMSRLIDSNDDYPQTIPAKD